MKEFVFNCKTYLIDDSIWEKHLLMHPVRPEEALASNLRIIYGNDLVTSEDIESTIIDEYKMQTNFADSLEEAEKLDLKKYGLNTNEYRAFYLNGQVVSINRNSNQTADANQPPDKLIQKYSRLQSSFNTVDYAECEDGSFKVIETGDGGVSGLPEELSADVFYKRCVL